MQEIARRFKIEFRLVAARDHALSYAQLEAGAAEAFATDDVLLYGLVAQHKAEALPGRRRISLLRPLRHHVPQETTRSSPSW